MDVNELLDMIVKKTGKSIADVKAIADVKVQQLSGMITKEGALLLVAKENGIDVTANPIQGVKTIDTPTEISEEDTIVIGSSGSDEELSLDDLGKKFIKNPKVNEEIEFTLSKIKKSKNIDATDKNGKAFKTNLTSVDYKMVYLTSQNEEYCPKAWSVVGKINGICKKLNKIDGVQLKIKHIKDGMKDKEGEAYSVKTIVDGQWKELDRKSGNWV